MTNNNLTITVNKMTLSIVIIVALVAIIGFLTYQLYLPKTGYATVNQGPANQGPYQGFSTYEEMMQAHHGGSQDSSQGVGGCGSESTMQINTARGEMLDYGISYDQEGYQQLLNYDNSISLDSEQMENYYIGLNVHLPQCCEFRTLQATGNCECGHHIALSGLAKLLASKGYTREQIQVELDKWKLLFYPEGSAGTGEC